MPRIVLKHKSPEYADPREKSAKATRFCEMPGCPAHAEHKAPKHRALNEHYWFCIDHVREYNLAWDFFSGMSENEVQNHMHSSLYGDRPTWRYAGEGSATEHLRRAAEETYAYNDGATRKQKQHNQTQYVSTPETEAMAIMGLAPPVTLEEIKTRYKTLAKKHHPDLNKNDPDAEELLKRINMAYTILKLAFEEYKKLPDAQY